MGGSTSSVLGAALDPLDITGKKRNKAKAEAADARAQAASKAAMLAEEKRIAAEKKAAEDLKAQEEDARKKLEAGKMESSRSALSNYLAAEGQQSSGRRRFLVGAR